MNKNFIQNPALSALLFTVFFSLIFAVYAMASGEQGADSNLVRHEWTEDDFEAPIVTPISPAEDMDWDAVEGQLSES